MTNMDDFISDEMLAAYLEGTSTPLENMIIEKHLNDENIREIVELSTEYDQIEDMSVVDCIDMSEIIDSHMRPFEEYEELKRDIEPHSGDNIL